MNFKGLGVALVTPFLRNRKIDYNSLPGIIENIISGGANYLVLFGTTAEVVCLDDNEKKEIIKIVFESNKNRVPLIIGIGGNNTYKVISEINSTDLSPFQGILSVSPYYNKPSQEGIYHHYAKIAETSSLPIIVYNVPHRTGINIKSDTFIRLTKNHKNIIAIKDATGDLFEAQKIIKEAPKNIQVISGDDALTLPMLLAGAVGTISVLGNALPGPLIKIFKHVEKGNLSMAYQLHYKLIDIIQKLSEEGNPVGIKGLMGIMGLCSNQVRLPLVNASSDLINQMKKILENDIFSLK